MGQLVGKDFAAAGNMLASEAVLKAVVASLEENEQRNFLRDFLTHSRQVREQEATRGGNSPRRS